jgi:hypothetical protein
MPRLSTDEIRQFNEEVVEWAKKVEELEKLANETTGENRSAYAIVHKDYLWKIQRKIAELWVYVSIADDINPFEERKSQSSETVS